MTSRDRSAKTLELHRFGWTCACARRPFIALDARLLRRPRRRINAARSPSDLQLSSTRDKTSRTGGGRTPHGARPGSGMNNSPRSRARATRSPAAQRCVARARARARPTERGDGFFRSRLGPDKGRPSPSAIIPCFFAAREHPLTSARPSASSSRFFETFSFLPPLSDQEIARQVQYLLNNGWTPCIEFESAEKAYCDSHGWTALTTTSTRVTTTTATG